MTDIHSCSYYCDRPQCIKAQRDELRDKVWVGVTDEEIMEMMGYDKQYGYIPDYARNFVEAIDQALKEKNHELRHD